MKQWVVLSGKGGTGKTTIAAGLASLAAKEFSIALADADVDAANLELLLSPQPVESHDFVGGKVALIDEQLCEACDVCAEVCRFEAVVASNDAYRVDPTACEGCAACYYCCPTEAITMVDQVSGKWFYSQTRYGPLFHARLFAGQENSGKLVTKVRQNAQEMANKVNASVLLVDGPPGIGCPVIAATTGADLALLVVEPSVSGLHDLERILGTTRHFSVPAAICINKSDINPTRSAEVVNLCAHEGVLALGTIPFDTTAIDAMVHRRPITEYNDGPASDAVRRLWEELKGRYL